MGQIQGIQTTINTYCSGHGMMHIKIQIHRLKEIRKYSQSSIEIIWGLITMHSAFSLPALVSHRFSDTEVIQYWCNIDNKGHSEEQFQVTVMSNSTSSPLTSTRKRRGPGCSTQVPPYLVWYNKERNIWLPTDISSGRCNMRKGCIDTARTAAAVQHNFPGN